MRARILIAAALAALLAAPGAASAQQDGVFYDNDSSAGKEYAVPHEQAREAVTGVGGSGGGGSDGTSGGQSGGSAEPQTPSSGGGSLFGEGIKRAGDHARGRNGGGVAGSSLPSAAAQSGGSSLRWPLGIVGAVLGLGALLAFALRRGARNEPGRLRRLLGAR